ncbi:MAG: hypothetical protein IKJ05_06745 [Oscillospiraceae bacterium]|nr:hypothetical protein [Oscillospiraceae bacterium]
MKHLLAGIAAVAAVGAVVGVGYMYYKKNKASAEDYEEYIFTEDMENDFGDVEPIEEAEDVVIFEDVVPQDAPVEE